MAKQRTDAERRARQCERLSRVLRVLKLISGPVRWDAEALAKELECSTRTIHRLLQTLSMAEVPWYFDEKLKCYRVRKGFRFPGAGVDPNGKSSLSPADLVATQRMATRLRDDLQRAADTAGEFCDTIAAMLKAATAAKKQP
jgi:predicted DNA-binding transcriptional regulator YafY